MTFLLIMLLFIHFMADYTPLSAPWMLTAKKYGTPIGPIAAHAGVHATIMLATMVGFSPWMAFAAAALQFFTHWIIDIGKGKLAYYVPCTGDNQNQWYWIIMGFDQLLHQIVIICMVHMIF